MIVLDGLDLVKTELKNALFHIFDGANPGSPTVGQNWLRSDTGRLHYQNSGGTQTVALLSDVTANGLTEGIFDAQTVLVAIADNTPIAQTVAAGQFVGRPIGGNIGVITAAQARTILNVENNAAADQLASEVPVTPVGNISATTVQAALAQLDTIKAAASHTHTLANITDAGALAALSTVATGQITNAAVTNVKLANMANATIKGRTTAGTGSPEDLTATQVRAILGIEAGATADQVASEVPFTPAGGIAASNVQTALEELDTEKAAASHTHTLANITDSGALAALDTVDTTEIEDGAVTAAKIAALTITGAQLAAGAVTTGKYATESILNADIGDGQIDWRKIAVGTILTDRLANDAVTNAKLAIMATATIKGPVTAATGDPEDLSVAQVLTLLGIEAGATADQTAAEILAALRAVDGAGSGLDADTLDGVQLAALATTSYVDNAIDNLIDAAPGTLDTLNEIATALGDDPNFATTITNLINAKPDKYAQNIGNGVATSIAVTHNLGTKDVSVTIRDLATDAGVLTTWVATTTNVVTLTFDAAPATDAYRVVIIG